MERERSHTSTQIQGVSTEMFAQPSPSWSSDSLCANFKCEDQEEENWTEATMVEIEHTQHNNINEKRAKCYYSGKIYI